MVGFNLNRGMGPRMAMRNWAHHLRTDAAQESIVFTIGTFKSAALSSTGTRWRKMAIQRCVSNPALPLSVDAWQSWRKACQLLDYATLGMPSTEVGDTSREPWKCSNANIAQWLVHLFRKQKVASSNLAVGFKIHVVLVQLHPWPSGLRRPTQVRFSSGAWVRIPPDAAIYFF